MKNARLPRSPAYFIREKQTFRGETIGPRAQSSETVELGPTCMSPDFEFSVLCCVTKGRLSLGAFFFFFPLNQKMLPGVLAYLSPPAFPGVWLPAPRRELAAGQHLSRSCLQTPHLLARYATALLSGCAWSQTAQASFDKATEAVKTAVWHSLLLKTEQPTKRLSEYREVPLFSRG